MLDEIAGLATELEHRHLAFTAIADPERHHGGADARADVDRALGLVAVAILRVQARAIEAVNVLVTGDAADRELVQARQRHLAAVRVARQHQRHAVAPQTVGLLGDVRQRDGGEIAAQALHGFVAAGVAGVRVIEADQLKAFVAKRDHRVLIGQHFDAGALERVFDLFAARPVIVVAEHGDNRRLEGAHHIAELVEIELAVADEVAGQQHDVGLLRVRHLDGRHLHFHGRDTADVQVGQVRDAQMRDLIAVGRGPGEAAQLDAVAARGP